MASSKMTVTIKVADIPQYKALLDALEKHLDDLPQNVVDAVYACADMENEPCWDLAFFSGMGIDPSDVEVYGDGEKLDGVLVIHPDKSMAVISGRGFVEFNSIECKRKSTGLRICGFSNGESA